MYGRMHPCNTAYGAIRCIHEYGRVLYGCMADTSIRVSEELADELYRRKGRSTSYEDFIWQLLDGDQPAATIEADSELLADWEPQTDANAERARAETQRVLDWLRETGGRHSRREIVDGVGPEEGDDYWWRAVVRPGLSELADRGVVEYRAGHHDYKAVEK